VSRLLVGLSLALLASVTLNVSYLMQHAGASSAPLIDIRTPLRTMKALLSSPMWFAGGVLGTAGWGLHVTALTKAPLSLVQAFLVGGTALIAPIAVRVLGHRLTPGEVAGIALMALALLALTLGRTRIGIHSRFADWQLGGYLAVSAAAAAALLLLAKGRRAQGLGLAGGILYGAADVAIKALTGIASRHGLGTALTSVWLVAAVVTSVTAFFCFQRGLQAGKAIPVIALMTAGTIVVSVLGGLIVFGDPLGRHPLVIALHVSAFVGVAVAAWLLAPAQAAVTVGDEDVPGSGSDGVPASGSGSGGVA
jgi:hypothetical protein